MFGNINKALAYTLIIFVLLLLGLLLKSDSSAVEFAKPISFPLTIHSSEEYSNKLLIHAIQPKLRFHLQANSTVTLQVGKETKSCSPSVECIFITKPTNSTSIIKISGPEGATVSLLSFDIVKYKNITTIESLKPKDWKKIGIGLLLLIVLGIVFYKRQAALQWITILLTSALLLKISPYFTITLYLFLFSIFKLRAYIHEDSLKPLRLIFFISYAVLFLLFFKYGQAWAFSVFANPGGISFFMPLGVSYFVIRIIDTQLRWYRKQQLEINFREFVFFIIFPGTLIAGPIENINDFFKNRITKQSRDNIAYGLSRVILGVFKKVVIADAVLYPLIHGVFLSSEIFPGVNQLIADPSSATGEQIMLFAVAGLLYAYVDFSAYSDMAIGLSRLLGYKVRENFNFPILAVNIREYWKRWHMSLSEWSFRNIYFPLMIQTRNTYIPVFATMLTIGLWHAYSLSWFSWAAHHATGMMTVSLLQKNIKVSAFILTLLAPLRIALTILFASMGFVFVYFSNYSIASELYVKYLGWVLFLN